MNKVVYRIVVARPMGGSFIQRERYYEPAPLNQDEINRIEAGGFFVEEQKRVRVSAEYRRLTGTSLAASREVGRLRGASSAYIAAEIAAATADKLARDVLAAAEGHGSLRE
jgi:hypothetical protein